MFALERYKEVLFSLERYKNVCPEVSEPPFMVLTRLLIFSSTHSLTLLFEHSRNRLPLLLLTRMYTLAYTRKNLAHLAEAVRAVLLGVGVSKVGNASQNRELPVTKRDAF